MTESQLSRRSFPPIGDGLSGCHRYTTLTTENCVYYPTRGEKKGDVLQQCFSSHDCKTDNYAISPGIVTSPSEVYQRQTLAEEEE